MVSDGTKIAFASSRDGNNEIYVMDADGNDQVRITTNLAIDLEPTWSPDGAKIAWATNRDGNFEIYAMNADGNGVNRKTTDSAQEREPDWSPDGARIAFTTNRTVFPEEGPGVYHIWVMNANGTGERLSYGGLCEGPNLTFGPPQHAPDWSPSGSRIVYRSSGTLDGESCSRSPR